MKDILLLFTASFLLSASLTLAGDRELNEEEASKALELWRKHCLDQNGDGDEPTYTSFQGYNSYGPPGGSKAQIHCKFGPDYPDESNKVVVKPTYATPPKPIKQIIFITPPVHNVRHEITLQGDPSPPRKTTIYVFPAKSTHQFQYQDNRVPSHQRLKPVVYFLKNNQLLQNQNVGPTYEQNSGYGPSEPIQSYRPIPQDDGGYAPAYESAASTLPIQESIQRLVLKEPIKFSNPSPSTFRSYFQKPLEINPNPPSYKYTNVLLDETTKRPLKPEKPSFDIVPATFGGYYYSGPNENNVNIPTELN